MRHFGLIGGKIYAWGYGGVRLASVEIDRKKMYLCFGKEGETLHMELLHSLTDGRSVSEICQKLLCETGVTAGVSDW